jgi:hypothetical protein
LQKYRCPGDALARTVAASRNVTAFIESFRVCTDVNKLWATVLNHQSMGTDANERALADTNNKYWDTFLRAGLAFEKMKDVAEKHNVDIKPILAHFKAYGSEVKEAYCKRDVAAFRKLIAELEEIYAPDGKTWRHELHDESTYDDISMKFDVLKNLDVPGLTTKLVACKRAWGGAKTSHMKGKKQEVPTDLEDSSYCVRWYRQVLPCFEGPHFCKTESRRLD